MLGGEIFFLGIDGIFGHQQTDQEIGHGTRVGIEFGYVQDLTAVQRDLRAVQMRGRDRQTGQRLFRFRCGVEVQPEEGYRPVTRLRTAVL